MSRRAQRSVKEFEALVARRAARFRLVCFSFGGIILILVVVNAATGEVQGDRPWSWIKIALASVVGAIVVALVYYFAR